MSTQQFTLVVPNSNKPISIVKVWVTLTDTNPATFTIAHSLGPTNEESKTVNDLPTGQSANLLYFAEGSGGGQPALVTFDRPSGPAGDPLTLTCLIIFSLRTNFDPSSCQSALTEDDKWTVSVTGTAFTSVAQVSFTNLDP